MKKKFTKGYMKQKKINLFIYIPKYKWKLKNQMIYKVGS